MKSSAIKILKDDTLNLHIPHLLPNVLFSNGIVLVIPTQPIAGTDGRFSQIGEAPTVKQCVKSMNFSMDSESALTKITMTEEG